MSKNPSFCRRCGERFEDDNPVAQCCECGQLTICKACSHLHACCMPDACLLCNTTTTLSCDNCQPGKGHTMEWILSTNPDQSRKLRARVRQAARTTKV